MVADSQKEEFLNPGEVNIEKIEIETITGELLNIIDITNEFNIYEDIFNNGVTGNVVLVDSVNVFNMGPIIGQETLRIKFKTPVVDPDPIKEYTFQIYKISKRELKNDRTQVYVLHFASIATIKNSLMKISKSFQGQISNMVNEIAFESEFLDSTVNTVLATRGSHKYVIPYWSPFKTINWLARRAITQESEDTNFVFYETLATTGNAVNGTEFNFVPLGHLYQKPPKDEFKYHFNPINRTQRETGKEQLYPDVNAAYYTINEYEILPSMDTLQAIRDGMWASRLISYDITTKKINLTSFNYLEHFRDSQTRNLLDDSRQDNPLIPDKANPAGFQYTDFPDSHIRRYDVQTQHQQNILNNQKPEEWLLQRQSTLKQLKMHRLRCVVPGNSLLRVGERMNLFLPSPGQDAESGDEDFLVSGNYLITSLRHIVKKNKYFSVMELAKTSFHNPIPTQAKDIE